MNESRLPFWLSSRGLATLGLITAASYFLLTEHLAHTIVVLPWLILLACPLFHFFMHRGHGAHGSSPDVDQNRPEPGRGER